MEQFNLIHTQFGEHLKNFIRSKVKNEEEVLDIYQNVILKIITKIDTVKKTESIKSWIFTIANNQITDYFRSVKPMSNVYDVAGQLNANDSDQTNGAAYEIMEGCVHNLIAQLPDEYRYIIKQSELNGISQKALAESLDLNYATLRSKVQRGRDRLKKMLNDSCLIEQAALGTVIDCQPKTQSACCGNQKPCE